MVIARYEPLFRARAACIKSKMKNKTSEEWNGRFKAVRRISMAISSKIPGYIRTFERGRGCGRCRESFHSHKRAFQNEKPRGTKVKGVKWGWVEATRTRKKFTCSCVLVKGVR